MLFVPAVVPAGCLKNVETWPRVASKYLHSPLLFEGCKFDLRYIVLVRSFDPLEVGPEASGVLRLPSCLVHAHHAVSTAVARSCLRQLYVCDVFWIRFSNKPYTLVPSSLDDYETHFTVRVSDVARVCSLFCATSSDQSALGMVRFSWLASATGHELRAIATTSRLRGVRACH